MSILIIGKGLVAGAVAVTALVAGSGTPHAAVDARGAAASGDAKVVCHRLWKNAPADLRKDLRALRALPQGDERRAAAKKIRKDALAGHYGSKVQAVAEHRKLRRAHWLRNAPDQLKQDLKAAAQKPAGSERRAALTEVWQSALEGTYGDQVQQRAEKRKAHHETCKAQREERRASRS